jgi:hypothetical protein
MTRDKALSITDQIKELLKNLAETENLKLDLGNISFSSTQLNLKISFQDLVLNLMHKTPCSRKDMDSLRILLVWNSLQILLLVSL